MSTTYARRNYARSTARGPIVIKNPAAPASEAQMRFVRSLVTEELLASLDATAVSADTFAALAAHVQGQALTMAQASAIIEGVKGLAAAHQEAKVAAATPGLAELNPTKVIPNQFGKACSVCGTWVDTKAGHAALINGAFRTFCRGCATTTAAERRAQQDAAARAAQALADAKAAVRAGIEALTVDLARRIGAEDTVRLGVALPNEAGTNDLTFVQVTRAAESTGGAVKVWHMVGGNKQFGVTGTWATRQLERIACLSADELAAAIALYSREFKGCSRCGLKLSDELSRDRGLGPDCYAKMAW